MCGDLDGGMWGETTRETTTVWFTWQGEVAACSGNTLAWLYQIQLFCPFDGCPAIIDVEFTVDAFGMGADGTQADHEFLGDLRPGKLSFEQAENFKLALAERLDEGLRNGGGGERRFAFASLLFSFKCCQQLAGIVWHNPVSGSFAK